MGTSQTFFKDASLRISLCIHGQDHNKAISDRSMFVHVSSCQPPNYDNYCSYIQDPPKISSKSGWLLWWTTYLQRGEASLCPDAYSVRCSASACYLHVQQLNIPGLLCGYVITSGRASSWLTKAWRGVIQTCNLVFVILLVGAQFLHTSGSNPFPTEFSGQVHHLWISPQGRTPLFHSWTELRFCDAFSDSILYWMRQKRLPWKPTSDY